MRIKLLIISTLMLVCASSFAQFTQGKGKSSSNSDNGWKSFYVQYNNIGTDYSFKDAEDQEDWNEVGLKDKMSGICIGYGKATPLSSSLPLFLEYGGGGQYSWYSCKSNVGYYYEKNSNIDVKLSLLSFKAPVGLAYIYTIPNSELSIEPSAGLYVRVNVYGNLNAKETYSSYYSDKEQLELNILKDKDCNGDAASIFQVGCHIGFNISYANYFIGISYNKDLSKIYDGYASVKLNTTSITAGIRF